MTTTPSATAKSGGSQLTQSGQKLSKDDIWDYQDLLNRTGFSPGKSDGLLGPKTRKALKAFQAAHGLKATGLPNDATHQALEKAVTDKVAKAGSEGWVPRALPVSSPAPVEARVPAPAGGFSAEQLSTLSAEHEGEVGTVTRDAGDPGGASYGLTQVSANTGSAAEFVSWLKSHHPDLASQIHGPPGSAQFDQDWKALAKKSPQAFGSAQLEQFKEVRYDVAVQDVAKRTGIDISKAPLPVQRAFWSTVVQHFPRGAAQIATAAFDLQKNNPDVIPDGTFNGKKVDWGMFIHGLYSERGLITPNGGLAHFKSSSRAIQNSVRHRFGRERLQALGEYLGATLDRGSVKDVMTPRPITLSGNETLASLRKRLPLSQMHNGYPVVDTNGKFLGLVTRHRLLDQAHPGSASVASLLPKKTFTLSAEMSVKDAFNLMTSKEVSQLPVLSKDGKLVGIITQMDLLRARRL